FDQLRWDLVEKARRIGRLILAEDAASGRGRQYEPSLRAGNPDVAEPSLLLELRLVVRGSRMRGEPLFETCDTDERTLEALSAVHRHHQDTRVLRALFFVDVGQERELIDETCQRRFGIPALVFARRRDELGEVLDAALGFLAALFAQVLQV